MNGVSRFLSRRDKHHEKRSLKHPLGKSRRTPPAVSADLYRVFTDDQPKSAEKDADKKNVKALLQRLQAAGITTLGEEQVQYALSWYPDDVDEAYNLLVLVNESLEGELKEYDANVNLLGAVNRNMVTCYLDALLFAMFARLDSFEAMLYDEFNDEPRKKLAAILRLWVNLLRTGRLIKVDFTKRLQDSISTCGWEEAAEVHQQDASEAFTFITGTLELPLLTLKMDIYHTGREDREDDHKFVNERLLEVAIPAEEEGKGVTLEDCLENYFNNRIEVKRYLQRQNTFPSIHSTFQESEKDKIMHIETVELAGPETPLVATPTTFGPPSPVSSARPSQGRRRGDSIFTERYTVHSSPDESVRFDEKKHLEEMLDNSSSGRPRSSSFLRKEVMMPAWQFFSLIPWYTDNVPQTDAQVAAHFSSKRPVLGICLKRYMMLPNGTSKRLDTYIDIPLEIGLPHFISDDHMQEEGPLFGNFKLVLQSVVCHRGVSVDSGHYISLVRANKAPTQPRPGALHTEQADEEDSWLRFDDLASPRVIEVDIATALREESPYLLFYQVQPINEDLASRGDPPSYAETQSVTLSAAPSKETLISETDDIVIDTGTGEWEKVNSEEALPPQVDSATGSDPPGRGSMSSQRRSFALEDLEGSTQIPARGRPPATPDDSRSSFLSASRRNSRAWLSGSKSRPSSESGENRLSVTLSRLTGRGSKDKLVPADNTLAQDPVIVVDEVPLSSETTQVPIDPASPQINPQVSPQANATMLNKNVGVSRSKSRKRFSKSRENIEEGAPVKGKHKAKNRPERECAVM